VMITTPSHDRELAAPGGCLVLRGVSSRREHTVSGGGESPRGEKPLVPDAVQKTLPARDLPSDVPRDDCLRPGVSEPSFDVEGQLACERVRSCTSRAEKMHERSQWPRRPTFGAFCRSQRSEDPLLLDSIRTTRLRVLHGPRSSRVHGDTY
jgi:hypothetical protein